MASEDGFSNTVHIKPFFHLHDFYYFGDVTMEFMNMPELGFFLRLQKGDKTFRMHYSLLLWIMAQEGKMGNFERVEEAGVEVTQNRFRLYFPLNGYVTTITPDESSNPVWREIVFEQHDEEEENELNLTRYEFARLEKLMPMMDQADIDQDEKRVMGLSGVATVGKPYPGFKCPICESFAKHGILAAETDASGIMDDGAEKENA